MRGGGVGGGEIVEVEGGHIVKSTGKKDRHSKVCTAKGPRDRRVRLSANTAIQFYDVQHRLGYDRPSKAVDWLIQKAKPAIDELAQLPPWNPTTTTTTTTTTNNNNNHNTNVHHNQQTENPTCLVGINDNQEDNIGGGGGNGLFYPHNNNNIGWFDGMVTWNDGVTDTDNNNSANDDGGFMFNNNNNNPFGQSQYLYYQRGPLQSSNNNNNNINPSIRAWIDAAPSSMLAADHYLLPAMMHQSVPGIGFSSGGFSGFRVPPRIQGQEEEHDGVSNKPSSASRY